MLHLGHCDTNTSYMISEYNTKYEHGSNTIHIKLVTTERKSNGHQQE